MPKTLARIYLAATYSRQAEMREVRERLIKAGYDVSSTWLDQAQGDCNNNNNEFAMDLAQRDFDEIEASDALLLITSNPAVIKTKIGPSHHVEFGISLARGLPIFIYGEQQSVFHTLPAVKIIAVNETKVIEAMDEYFDRGSSPVGMTGNEPQTPPPPEFAGNGEIDPPGTGSGTISEETGAVKA